MPQSDRSIFVRLERGLHDFRSGPVVWLILVGNRLVVAALLTILFGLGVALVVSSDAVAIRTTTQTIYLFQALVGGNLTLVTIVLSINQLVLSREFNTPGEQRERIENVVSYRNRVQETTNESGLPVTPADFLDTLLTGTRDTAEELHRAASALDRERVSDRAEMLADQILDHTDDARHALKRSQGNIFSALVVILEANYSFQLNEAQSLQELTKDDDAPEFFEALEEVVENLKQVDIARQYFKSVYMQSELARLSQILLYVGVPSIAATILMLIVYAGGNDAVSIRLLRVAVPVVTTIAFIPLAVLFAFVLRIAVVARRTVAITPFTTVPQEKQIAEE